LPIAQPEIQSTPREFIISGGMHGGRGPFPMGGRTVYGIRQVQQMIVPPNSRLSAIADANLPKDRLDVSFDGRFGDIKSTCDNLVGLALHPRASVPQISLAKVMASSRGVMVRHYNLSRPLPRRR
jgi:hypothetical protein